MGAPCGKMKKMAHSDAEDAGDDPLSSGGAVALKMRGNGNTYASSKDSRLLLDRIGGAEALYRMTTAFYNKVFREPHLEVFFQNTTVELHAKRLANWVAEKMGGYSPEEQDSQTTADYDPEDFSHIPRNSSEVGAALKDSTQQVRDDAPETAENLCGEDGAKCEKGCPMKQVRGVTDGIKQCPIWMNRHPWTTERELHRDLSANPIVKPARGFDHEDMSRRGKTLKKEMFVVHDRSTAHYAGWHSTKRPAEDVGTHFELDDCRVWLRLHFWACRECGLFGKDAAVSEIDSDSAGPALSSVTRAQFEAWYTKFLAHFVRVYRRIAPPFVPVECAWSLSKKNLDGYLTNVATGKISMPDVIDILSDDEALRKLSDEDRQTVTSVKASGWPYSQ